MSLIRQDKGDANTLIGQLPHLSVITRTNDMSANEHDAPHYHEWHQVIYPKKGILRTRVANSEYFVTSNRAVLVPAKEVHESWAISNTQFVGIYLNPEKVYWPFNASKIIEISPLVKELINYMLQLNTLGCLSVEDSKILEVLCDQLAHQPPTSLELLMPSDKRLLIITEFLLLHPDSARSLSQWAALVGASERTISRNFEKQTGLTFIKWRQRLRLICSLKYLEQGLPIKEVSYRVGYHSPSAFIQSFKKNFAITPQQYFN
ncbi:AraC family transcriptional regulator [Thalassotalea ganghwensis]